MVRFEHVTLIFCCAAVIVGFLSLLWNKRSFKQLMEAKEEREKAASFVAKANEPLNPSLDAAITAKVMAESSRYSARAAETYARAAKSSAEDAQRAALDLIDDRLRTTSKEIIVADYIGKSSVDLKSLLPKAEQDEPQSWKLGD